MKAAEKTIQGILHSSHQYVIPLFQRYYTWQLADWQRLWDDLQDLLESEDAAQRHFMGSIVLVPNRDQGGPPSFQVIDGQQRLITISLLLAAIRDVARAKGDAALAGEIDDYYLLHRYNSGDARYKILPRLLDRSEYTGVVDGKNLGGEGTIGAALAYFTGQVGLALRDTREVFEALSTRFDFVAITLDGENPFKIFESLNSKGIPLEQGDLIRNHVFMALPFEQQEAFDRDHWRPLEEHFTEDGQVDATALAAFFRDAMMSRGTYIAKKGTYEAFNRRYPAGGFSPMGVLAVFDELAGYNDLLEGRAEHESTAVTKAIAGLRGLNVSTSYPLMLRLLQLHAAGALDEPGLCTCIEAVASFVLRRFVCGKQSRGYGRWFCAACKGLDHDPEAALLEFLREKGWPSNKEFVEAFVTFEVYQSKYSRAVFEGLEQAQDAHRLEELEGASIEHIMPESLEDGRRDAYWIGALGQAWKEAHERWCHTPGNLTFVHAEHRNFLVAETFAERAACLRRSTLRLNVSLRSTQGEWTVAAIERRGKKLAKLATAVWKGPLGTSDAEARKATPAKARAPAPPHASKIEKPASKPTLQGGVTTLDSSYRFGGGTKSQQEQDEATIQAYLRRQQSKPRASVPPKPRKTTAGSGPRSYRYVRDPKTLTSPEYVVLEGKKHPVRFWNEVVKLAALEHFRRRGKPPKRQLLQKQQGLYVTDKRTLLRRPGALGNGWFIERNLSAPLACKVAEALLTEAGYRSSEFDIICVPRPNR
jgi:hypothetical protein